MRTSPINSPAHTSCADKIASQSYQGIPIRNYFQLLQNYDMPDGPGEVAAIIAGERYSNKSNTQPKMCIQNLAQKLPEAMEILRSNEVVQPVIQLTTDQSPSLATQSNSLFMSNKNKTGLLAM